MPTLPLWAVSALPFTQLASTTLASLLLMGALGLMISKVVHKPRLGEVQSKERDTTGHYLRITTEGELHLCPVTSEVFKRAQVGQAVFLIQVYSAVIPRVWLANEVKLLELMPRSP